MNLAPVSLEHGERFGKLTVLRKITSDKRGPKYVCGCVCGCKAVKATANQLMKGRVTACLKCTNPAPQSADSLGAATSAVAGPR